MPRGKLDKTTAAKIESGLPSVADGRKASLTLQPDFISMGFPVGSTIPIATVCLQDATSALEEVRYALSEAFSHVAWYRGKCEPPNEHLAVFFGKFYADDAALRIYAAAEHLANAIESMLEIKTKVNAFQKTKLSKRKNVVSKQAIVGNYLIENDRNHEVTISILKLKKSPEWKQTRSYRDDWVHNKPPIIAGSGIGYKRENRLKVYADSIGITVGGGDEPHLTIDELLGFIRPAAFLLTEVIAEIAEYLNKNQKREW